MNQNMQNSQNQVNKQQMTQEELQKTQVLNLQEVERVAKFEKRTSKKPALFFALLGILSITFGTTFGITEMLSANKTLNKMTQNRKTEEKKTDKKVTNKDLVCTLTSINNPDGTDTVYKIDYKFESEKLVGYTKTFTISPTPGNPQGPTGVQNYVTGYQPFMNQVPGYTITVTPSGTNLIVEVIVDYKVLDVTTLPPQQQNHFTTALDYQLNAEKETIQQEKESQGYTCE